MEESIKPVIKWAGGKSLLYKHYRQYIPSHISNYLEPFCGGCSFFLSLIRDGILDTTSKILIADINFSMIKMYISIKEDCENFIQELERIWEMKYNYVRTLYNEGNNDRTKQGALFYYLNKHCFNGLYRENKSGKFNVPVGKMSSGNSPTIEYVSIRTLSDVFNKYNVKIKCQDYMKSLAEFEEFVSPLSDEDFIYFDPPYPKVKSTSFVSYNKDEFDDKKFYEKLKNINDIRFLCSYSYTEDISIMIKLDNFIVKEITASRNINSNVKGRKGHKEIFFMNYLFIVEQE